MKDLLQKEISDCLEALQQPNKAVDNYRCYYEGRKALAEELLLKLQQSPCSTSLPLEPCPKEMYLLEYFGIKEFDENRRLTVDLGILTDLLYGFEQNMGRQ